MQNAPFLYGDVRNPVAGRHSHYEKAFSRINTARYHDQIDSERFVYPISCDLHYLLLDHAQNLLMQGRGSVHLVSAYAEDENATTNISQGAEIIGQVLYAVDLLLKVKVPGLAGAFADQSLDTSQRVNIGRDVEPCEEWIHNHQGILRAP
jgi:hypothetical protein